MSCIKKINEEIEQSGRYELATAGILNALLFKIKSTDSIEEDFKKLRSDYNHYWDLLDELNIDDDLREILISLFHKIDTYNTIDALPEVTKHKDRVLSLSKKYKKYFMPVLKAIHDNPGAYFALGIDFDLSADDKYNLALLINYHMRPLEAWKDSKKAEEKDKRLVGDGLYTYLKVLHTCDEMSEQDEDFVKEFLDRNGEM